MNSMYSRNTFFRGGELRDALWLSVCATVAGGQEVYDPDYDIDWKMITENHVSFYKSAHVVILGESQACLSRPQLLTAYIFYLDIQVLSIFSWKSNVC